MELAYLLIDSAKKTVLKIVQTIKSKNFKIWTCENQKIKENKK
jgi:hypothetical protein